jgi:hypothetical protein
MKRCVLLVLSLPLAFLSHVSAQATIVSAQATTGIAITKTCPGPAPVPPGSSFQCQFSVQNLDAANSVNTLAVMNTVPYPGGVTTGVPCKQGAVTVTVLGPFGTLTDTCTGAVDETAPACGRADVFFTDQVAATGFDANGGSTPFPVSATTTNQVTIAACTLPVVPTLNEGGMLLFGLLIAVAGVLLARRR